MSVYYQTPPVSPSMAYVPSRRGSYFGNPMYGGQRYSSYGPPVQGGGYGGYYSPGGGQVLPYQQYTQPSYAAPMVYTLPSSRHRIVQLVRGQRRSSGCCGDEDGCCGCFGDSYNSSYYYTGRRRRRGGDCCGCCFY